MRQIVWTRASVDWASDKHFFDQVQTPVMHLPCVEIKPLALPKKLPKQCSTGIFTSTHAAVFATNDTNLKSLIKTAELYTFGKKTCEVLKKAGLSVRRVEVNSGKAFAEHLAENLEKGAKVIFFRGKDVAFDTTSFLNSQGFSIDDLVLYETRIHLEMEPEHIAAFAAETEHVVCFASPSAVKGFVRAFSPQMSQDKLPWHTAVIGETTAKEARKHFSHIHVAREPSLKELSRLAVELTEKI